MFVKLHVTTLFVSAPPVSVGGAGVQRVIIPHPGVRPGQPGSQISVPLATLQSLQVCHWSIETMQASD